MTPFAHKKGDAYAERLLQRLHQAGKINHNDIALIRSGAAKRVDDIPTGSFNITELGFRGYPEGIPRPQGPFRLLEGAEYDAARRAANKANNQIRIDKGLRGQPVDVHEIAPVKFDGSPINPANKIIIDRALHRQQVTPWWNQLLHNITSSGGGG